MSLWLESLHAHKVSPQTITAFDIKPGKFGWRYPVPNCSGQTRQKRYDHVSNKYPKYQWLPSKPSHANYYHATDIEEQIQQHHGEVWLTGSDSDVWAYHSAGLPAIGTFGEMRLPKTLVDDLKRFGVKTVHIAPDNDDTGSRFASRVVEILFGTEISIRTHVVPGHKDINRYWQNFSGSAAEFAQSLYAQPEVKIELKKDTPKSIKKSVSNINISFDAWCQTVKETAEKKWKLKKQRHAEFSENIHCPFHDDEHPSATWSYESNSLYCFSCGLHNVYEVAELLEIDPFVKSENTWTPKENGSYALPNEVRELLIRTKNANTSRILEILLYVYGKKTVITRKQAIKTGKMWHFSNRAVDQVFDLLDSISELDDSSVKLLKEYMRNSSFGTRWFKGGKSEAIGLILYQDSKGNNPTFNSPGRRERVTVLPSMKTLLRYFKLEKTHSDAVAIESLNSRKEYVKAVHLIPIKREGQFRMSRKWEIARLGITRQTLYRYDKELIEAGIISRETVVVARGSIADKIEFEYNYKRSTCWLEDEDGNKYPPTDNGVRRGLLDHSLLAVYEHMPAITTYLPSLSIEFV